MLVLKRRLGEVLVLTGPDGTETRVAVVYIDRGGVRLGVEAPRSVTIDRLEVHEAKKRNPQPQKELTDADAEIQQDPRAEVKFPDLGPAPSYHPRTG